MNKLEVKLTVKVLEIPTNINKGISWSYSSISINKLVQMLTGNIVAFGGNFNTFLQGNLS